jgi:hypothetical protein
MDDDKNVDKQRAGQIGGAKRAEILPPKRRTEIAQKAAIARWGKLPRAIHKGNFEKDFGIDVDCYVLDDAQKTAVISQRGMGESLGLSGGKALPRFLASKAMVESLGAELREKIENPLRFQIGAGGAEPKKKQIYYGFDVTLLIDICNAIMAAESAGKMNKRYARLAKQAHIIVSASAKSGITRLVYTLAGYNPTAEEVIAAFKLYVQEEAREYEKEFPDQLYAEWYRLYKLPKPQKNKPWKFKHLTVEHVYEPLAKSNGKVYQLTQALRTASNERWKRLHQFLSEVGVKALRTQLGQTLGIAQVSDTVEQYEANIRRVFQGQPDLFKK